MSTQSTKERNMWISQWCSILSPFLHCVEQFINHCILFFPPQCIVLQRLNNTINLESNRGTLHTVYWNLVTLLQILMLPTVYWTLGPVPSRNINVTYGILNPWPDPRNKELCYDISEIPIVFYRLFEKTIVFSKRRSSYRLLKRRSSFEKTIVF